MRRFQKYVYASCGLALVFTAAGCGSGQGHPVGQTSAAAATAAGPDSCTNAAWDKNEPAVAPPDPAYQIAHASIALSGEHVVFKMTTKAPLPAPTSGVSIDSWGFDVSDPASPTDQYTFSASFDSQTDGTWDYNGSHYPDFTGASSSSTPVSATGSVSGSQVTLDVPVSELPDLHSHPLWKAFVLVSGGSDDCPGGVTTTQASDINLPGSTPSAGNAAPLLPYVVGQSLELARQDLSAQGYTNVTLLDATGRGRTPILYGDWEVVSETPQPNTPVAPSTTITLTVKKYSDQ